LAVVLHHFRIRPPALLLILGMLVPPLLLAFAYDLAILRVSRQFLAVIIGAAPVGTPAGCRPLAGDDRQKAERNTGSKDSGASSSPLLRDCEMNL